MLADIMARRTYTQTDLSRFLKRLRKNSRLSTSAVQELTSRWPKPLRISQGFLSQVERGATPSPYKLLALARVYETPLFEFFKAIGARENEIARAVICAEHEKYHRMLEEILHGPGEWGPSILSNVKSLWSTATGKPIPADDDPESKLGSG